MRVLMVIRPAAGGMKGHVAMLSRGMAARGIEVDVAAPEGSDVLVEAVSEGRSGYPVAIVGPLSPLADVNAARELGRVVREGDYDVVHAHGFKAALVARAAASFAGVPLVVTAHNHVLRRDDFSKRRKAIYRTAERALARYVACWIAISDSIREELVDDYGLPAERVSVVRNAIDLATFLETRDRAQSRAELGVSEDTPVFGTAARLAPQKGIETLIDALPTVLERVPGAVCVIGGEGPLESDLRVRAVALGVADAIVWPGRIADMPGFFAALDVFVSPSDLEGFALTLAEAQAAGAAVVATRAGGAAEVVHHDTTALLVDPKDPFALGTSTARLLLDSQLAHRLGTTARVHAVKEFDPERMVAETLDVYERVSGVPAMPEELEPDDAPDDESEDGQ